MKYLIRLHSSPCQVFVSYLTSAANDICKEAKRQTISAEDVFTALQDLDFGELVPPTKDALEGIPICTEALACWIRAFATLFKVFTLAKGRPGNIQSAMFFKICIASWCSFPPGEQRKDQAQGRAGQEEEGRGGSAAPPIRGR